MVVKESGQRAQEESKEECKRKRQKLEAIDFHETPSKILSLIRL